MSSLSVLRVPRVGRRQCRWSATLCRGRALQGSTNCPTIDGSIVRFAYAVVHMQCDIVGSCDDVSAKCAGPVELRGSASGSGAGWRAGAGSIGWRRHRAVFDHCGAFDSPAPARSAGRGRLRGRASCGASVARRDGRHGASSRPDSRQRTRPSARRGMDQATRIATRQHRAIRPIVDAGAGTTRVDAVSAEIAVQIPAARWSQLPIDP